MTKATPAACLFRTASCAISLTFQSTLHQHRQKYYSGGVAGGAEVGGSREYLLWMWNTIYLILEAILLALRTVASGVAGNCWDVIRRNDMGLDGTVPCHHAHLTSHLIRRMCFNTSWPVGWMRTTSLMHIAGSHSRNYNNLIMGMDLSVFLNSITVLLQQPRGTVAE